MTGKGYIVVTYRKITNQDKWAAYAKLAAPAPEQYWRLAAPPAGWGSIVTEQVPS